MGADPNQVTLVEPTPSAVVVGLLNGAQTEGDKSLSADVAAVKQAASPPEAGDALLQTMRSMEVSLAAGNEFSYNTVQDAAQQFDDTLKSVDQTVANTVKLKSTETGQTVVAANAGARVLAGLYGLQQSFTSLFSRAEWKEWNERRKDKNYLNRISNIQIRKSTGEKVSEQEETLLSNHKMNLAAEKGSKTIENAVRSLRNTYEDENPGHIQKNLKMLDETLNKIEIPDLALFGIRKKVRGKERYVKMWACSSFFLEMAKKGSAQLAKISGARIRGGAGGLVDFPGLLADTPGAAARVLGVGLLLALAMFVATPLAVVLDIATMFLVPAVTGALLAVGTGLGTAVGGAAVGLAAAVVAAGIAISYPALPFVVAWLGYREWNRSKEDKRASQMQRAARLSQQSQSDESVSELEQVRRVTVANESDRKSTTEGLRMFNAQRSRNLEQAQELGGKKPGSGFKHLTYDPDQSSSMIEAAPGLAASEHRVTSKVASDPELKEGEETALKGVIKRIKADAGKKSLSDDEIVSEVQKRTKGDRLQHTESDIRAEIDKQKGAVLGTLGEESKRRKTSLKPSGPSSGNTSES
jgi:hypothetical protein